MPESGDFLGTVVSTGRNRCGRGAGLSRNREAATGMTAAQWTLLAMLIASIFLNYIDRSNLSLAVPSIEHEFSLSPIQTGRMLGAFFWTYALLQLFGIAGWFADRFSVSLIL